MFLQNKLTRSNAKMEEIAGLVNSKGPTSICTGTFGVMVLIGLLLHADQEVSKLSSVVEAYEKDEKLGGDANDATNVRERLGVWLTSGD